MDTSDAIATRVALNISRLCNVRKALNMVSTWEKIQPYWGIRLTKVKDVLIRKERALESNICKDMNI